MVPIYFKVSGHLFIHAVYQHFNERAVSLFNYQRSFILDFYIVERLQDATEEVLC